MPIVAALLFLAGRADAAPVTGSEQERFSLLRSASWAGLRGVNVKELPASLKYEIAGGGLFWSKRVEPPVKLEGGSATGRSHR